MTRLLVFISVMLASSSAFADGLSRDLNYLAAAECEGRDVGTAGHDRARDYIVKQMKAAGLEPAGEEGWLVPVSIVRDAVPVAESQLKIGNSVLAPDAEYQILGFSDGNLEGPAIFLGYGLHTPQYGWDDLGQHNLKNRVVIAFTGAPPSVEEAIRPADQYLTGEASKAAVALSRGAKGIIFVNNPRTTGDGTGQRADTPGKLRPRFPLRGIAAARVTERAALRVFRQMELDLLRYQDQLDFGKPFSIEVPLEVAGILEVKRDVIVAHNVVGKLPGGEGAPVVLGAHYDHLGMGGPGSLHQGKPKLHPGADDNASGVAVLLESARRLRGVTTARPIYFAALTGEERALRGARRLAPVLAGRGFVEPAQFINLDMVGRLFDNKLRIYSKPSGTLFQHALDAATSAGLTLELKPPFESISDHQAFADVGFEVISFSTGHHRDYHRPSDTVDRIDWRGLRAVADLITALLRSFVTG